MLQCGRLIGEDAMSGGVIVVWGAVCCRPGTEQCGEVRLDG